MASSDANESPRIEIEIATVLFGFLFVIYSIILTTPSDVITLLDRTTYTGPLYSGNAAKLFSIYGFSCALGLLTAIPLYLFYRKNRREWVLALARSFLALSMFFFVNLVLIMNAFAMSRLVGTQGNEYLNPISGLAMLLSLIAFPYILWLWLRLSPKLQSFWKKH
jgi:hypothetical protein